MKVDEKRVLQMQLFFELCFLVTISLVHCHVPTYDNANCEENCCPPPRVHTTSQVIYVKGSGGLHIHVEDDKTPFDTMGEFMIDVNAVFRDEIDQTTYSLFIGCGYCVPSEGDANWDSYVPLLDGYNHGEIEPFTQTSHRSVFKGDRISRQYNSKLLNAANCPQKHFSIRLVDYMNRTNGKPVVWGAVIGFDEKFTLEETISYPLYILNNHGHVWNEMGWTFPMWLILVPLCVYLTDRFLKEILQYNVIYTPIWTYNGDLPPNTVIYRPLNLRECYYLIAIVSFMIAGCEELTHLMYAQFWTNTRLSLMFLLGIMVIVISQVVPIITTWGFWVSLRVDRDYMEMASDNAAQPNKQQTYKGTKRMDPFSTITRWNRGRVVVFNAFPFWGVLELGLALLYLLVNLGAGFFLGPAMLILASLVRFYESSVKYGAAEMANTNANIYTSGGDGSKVPVESPALYF